MSSKRIVELKIKLKSLAAEAKIIRLDENKARQRARLADAQIQALDGHKLSHSKMRTLDVTIWSPSEELVDHAGARAEFAAFTPATPKATREQLVGRAERSRATWLSLKSHRKGTVGHEARISLLAYAFLRGVPYSHVEQPNTRERPPWAAVFECAKRFGGVTAVDEYGEWTEAALEHLRTGHSSEYPTARLAPWRP